MGMTPLEGHMAIHIRRREFIALLGDAAALLAVPRIANAQAYPSRPVRIIVGFAAGGGSDIIARIIGQWLSDRLGKPFVIENRPGAGTNIATEAVVRAPADGYTLLLVNSSGVNAAFYDKLNANVVRDIAPVASISREANIMVVHPSVPAKTVPEFITYAKANPGKISMASSGNGTLAHMAGELFKMMTGLNLVHVPYRGGAPALTDMLGGQVQIMSPVVSSAIEYVKSGKLRALAATTEMRLDVLPDTPTLAEFVPGYEASAFYGIGAPRNTPATIIDKLNNEINAALRDASIRTRLADVGSASLTGLPADFGRHIADETEKWAKVIKFAGLNPD
jgi:tripartite-type tricarboxylate transporter receptor subunit TctC